jgi:alkane 1-monooxygenase
MSPSSWYYLKLIAFSGFPIIPLLAPTGHYTGLPWLSPFFIFVLIPGLDLLLGSDRTVPLERAVPRAARLWLYLVPHFYVVAWLGVLLWAALVLPRLSSPLERVSLLIAVALASAFATCAGHELVHRPSRLDRFMSRVTMATVAYGQFVTEHLHHHATVGIVRAGTTPTFGQSVWSFVARNVLFSFRNSWRIERRRQLAAGKPLLGNVYVQQWLATGLIFGTFVALGGPWGAVLFVAQAGFAIFALEYINYAEHYGLTRRPSDPLSGRLAWSSNGFMTNAMTLNITRHAHHHESPGVPYQDLRHMETMPLLPAGYFALFFPAMVPPLWRRIMDESASEVVNVLQAEHVG